MEKRIVVLGAGESGCGAAILADKLGFEVFVSDFGIIRDTENFGAPPLIDFASHTFA